MLRDEHLKFMIMVQHRCVCGQRINVISSYICDTGTVPGKYICEKRNRTISSHVLTKDFQ